MSTMNLDLNDRVITDTGAMVAKFKLVVDMALDDKDFSHLITVPHPDIAKYHLDHNTINDARQWTDDGVPKGPSQNTYEWTYPESYKKLDVEEYCLDMMIVLGLDESLEYVDRMSIELQKIQEKEMEPFIRCMIWITDVFRKNNMVWGLGRGSSCASLIMYIIGVNKVDPIRYDIPMEEFYK